jgi:outer membrane protein TolC
MMNVAKHAKTWALGLAAVALTVAGVAAQAPAPTPAAPAAPTTQQPAPAPAVPQTPAPATAGAPAATPPQAPLGNPTAGPPPDRYVPGQATPPVEPGQQVVNMTLQQAMDIALENNLDLKVARMNPPAVDYQLQAARAAYTPQLTSTYSYQNAASPNNNNLEKATTLQTHSQNYNGGMTDELPFYGATLQANFTNSRTATNSTQSIRNPSFASRLSFTYTQPLLQGFSIDQTRNQIRTLQVQRQITDIQLLTTIENTKASVRTAYWNLRQAIESIEIERRALDLAQRLLQDNQVKVQIGTMAPIETTQSETQVANAQQALLNARITWQTAQINLQRLLANGPEDPINQEVINPTEQLQSAITLQNVDIAAAVKTALAQRTDLEQARKNIEVSQLNLEVSQNLTKPTVNLQAGYNAAGQGGPTLLSDGTRSGSGYADAFAQVFGLDLPTWNVQFNVTYPLFMRAARANYARAALQVQQSQAQLKSTELSVASSVTNAGLAIQNSYQQYQAAQTAREVAERNADAEQTRFDVGMSTNYDVVQAQNNLTEQRLNELRALISYLNAVAEFDRQQRVGGSAGGGATGGGATNAGS